MPPSTSIVGYDARHAAIIETTDAPICLLSESGLILSHNEHWRLHCAQFLCSENEPCVSYSSQLAACLDEGVEQNNLIMTRIDEVCRGARPEFEEVFKLHSRDGERSFQMRILHIDSPDENAAMVVHSDCSENLVVNEKAGAGKAPAEQIQRPKAPSQDHLDTSSASRSTVMT